MEATTSAVKSVIASTHLRSDTTTLPFNLDDVPDEEAGVQDAAEDDEEEEEEGEAEWGEDADDGSAPQKPVEEFIEGMAPVPDSSAEESQNSEEEEEDEDLDATTRKRSRRATGNASSSSSSSAGVTSKRTSKKTRSA